MITVGLIQELYFIHKLLGLGLDTSVKLGNNQSINISISDNILTINYSNNLIWTESLDDSTSLFGIESCESIMQIIKHIDNDDDSWRNKYITHIP